MPGRPECLYAAFDTYPAPKGAAVHIREFAGALFGMFGNGLLLTLGAPDLPAWQIEPDCEIRRLVTDESNFLKKAGEYSAFVAFHADLLKDNLRIAHFRDPWGGLPILNSISPTCRTIYEVNALPSIELPTRFRGIPAPTLEKIIASENECLQRADAIICPSEVIRACLLQRGVADQRITVIRNGASAVDPLAFSRPEGAPEQYMLYFGAVQTWQGIETLFRAMPLLADLSNLHLVLCVSGNKLRLKFLNRLAERLKISERLHWQYRLSQNELLPWLAHADLAVAPLTECARNLQQGCCPLKIIEAMAMGVTVLASDLPVVRELLDHNQTGWLTRPDRPSELARAVRILMAHPEARQRISAAGREKARRDFSWQQAIEALQNLYRQLN
ncbi:MAG TPA: glycosyltransferase family 4 protein [Candidatus Rifleibacterium sp.]|nr:glycosyltransferase family 4 protein [Candidatus Rifleibacterium sp.]HPT48382.1 glycosyltransferase family 4 protein [Candidatus Rifleibacterium sp.]